MKRLFVLLAVVATALLVVGCVSAYKISNHQPVAKALPPVYAPVCSPDSEALLNLINQERVKVGVPALRVDNALMTAATEKLNDMVKGAYYGHKLLDGSEPWRFERSQGVTAALGEDIDINALTPQADWVAFKNSPPHYASLTNALYSRVGLEERCTSYPIEHSTGPDDNSGMIGTTAHELTVVELAAPEPVQNTQASCPVTTCADGSCSGSTGSGTCSWHQGEAY